jgi:hypothetical protein
LALTSPTSGGRSVGIVRLRAKAMEFSFYASGKVIDLNDSNQQILSDISVQLL